MTKDTPRYKRLILKLANHPVWLAIFFLGNLLFAAVAFSVIESQTFLDSIYWADITAFTVGYGDISPEKALGKVLAIYFATSQFFLTVLVSAKAVVSLMLDQDKFSDGEQKLIFSLILLIARHVGVPQHEIDEAKRRCKVDEEQLV